MTHAQLVEAGAALVVLVAAALGYGRKRRGGSSGRPPAGPSRGSSRPRSKASGRAPSRLPEPREIWWAEVPFEDGPGSKDRPCLVLHRRAGTATVLKITSKHHAERPGVLALPPGTVDDRDHRPSWLETDESREVPLENFRRRVGTLGGGLWSQVRKARA